MTGSFGAKVRRRQAVEARRAEVKQRKAAWQDYLRNLERLHQKVAKS